MTKKDDRKLFEQDRRMELKMRIATKRLVTNFRAQMPDLQAAPTPEPGVVDRLIERVRAL
jgi:hypothetical protein